MYDFSEDVDEPCYAKCITKNSGMLVDMYLGRYLYNVNMLEMDI